MKASYDRQAKDRQLEKGTFVLVRTPYLKGKLEDVWVGPFKVTRRISPVTYEIVVPRRRSKHMVTHIINSHQSVKYTRCLSAKLDGSWRRGGGTSGRWS